MKTKYIKPLLLGVCGFGFIEFVLVGYVARYLYQILGGVNFGVVLTIVSLPHILLIGIWGWLTCHYFPEASRRLMSVVLSIILSLKYWSSEFYGEIITPYALIISIAPYVLGLLTFMFVIYIAPIAESAE